MPAGNYFLDSDANGNEALAHTVAMDATDAGDFGTGM
jgi:hypothetical protein